MPDPQKIWLNKLTKLNPNVSLAKGSGAGRFAPHKPILLLALIDAAEAGELLTPQANLTPGVRVRFNAFWAIVMPRWKSKPDPTMPFHYLSSQGFWKTRTEDGRPSRSVCTTVSIELHPDFYLLLQQPQFRDLARRVLVQTWFPPLEQAALKASLFLEESTPLDTKAVAEAEPEARAVGRNARFRIEVIVQYRYTCALTGYTLTTHTGASIVEAAHIAAFADSRNNDARNGLALTPNAHWSFDEGLWTIDDDLRIVVAKDAFFEWTNGESLNRLHGKPLTFAPDVKLCPEPRYLEWHRERCFVG
ncbi:MAG: HNH endonuclease [Opitutaceae bacterium]|nr:HNH endonuclease [Opitutaceae bacterium]